MVRMVLAAWLIATIDVFPRIRILGINAKDSKQPLFWDMSLAEAPYCAFHRKLILALSRRVGRFSFY